MTLDNLSEFQRRSLRSALNQKVQIFVRQPANEHTLDLINIDLRNEFDRWKSRHLTLGEELEVVPVAEITGLTTISVHFRKIALR